MALSAAIFLPRLLLASTSLHTIYLASHGIHLSIVIFVVPGASAACNDSSHDFPWELYITASD